MVYFVFIYFFIVIFEKISLLDKFIYFIIIIIIAMLSLCQTLVSVEVSPQKVLPPCHPT